MFDPTTSFAYAASLAANQYPTGEDPTPFMPLPTSLKNIAKLAPKVRDAWNRAYLSELKNLLHKGTFQKPTHYDGEHYQSAPS